MDEDDEPTSSRSVQDGPDEVDDVSVVYEEEEPTFPRIVQFRLGRSTVSAAAEAPYDGEHPHVFRVTVLRGVWERRFAAFLSKLPGRVRAWIRGMWPGWFLPATVVLKKWKRDWDDEFDEERDAYDTLKPLQGDLIPVFYGKTRCEGTRALVLSDADGVAACRQGMPPLPPEEFRRRVETVYRKLGALGFSFHDANLGHILLTRDGGAMLVDLESAFRAEPEDLELEASGAIDQFARQYRLYLNGLELDGLIGRGRHDRDREFWRLHYARLRGTAARPRMPTAPRREHGEGVLLDEQGDSADEIVDDWVR
ncbi:hypothetical protein VTK73DRAFT_3048 [Phialemonium thermophilum]|uniref:Lipopolysaccharide kinase (Kdo/WaaP) family protein n=1 Tax=Phialemonium thermophilum TaxID=223376 RepID=A0ABR3VNK7_9PEZI